MSQTAQPMRGNKRTFTGPEKKGSWKEVYEDKTNDWSGPGLMILRGFFFFLLEPATHRILELLCHFLVTFSGLSGTR